jgi:ribosomal protein S21
MIVTRTERETNQQVLRRFNRLLQASDKLNQVRDRRHFAKKATRFSIKSNALRKAALRTAKQWY